MKIYLVDKGGYSGFRITKASAHLSKEKVFEAALLAEENRIRRLQTEAAKGHAYAQNLLSMGCVRFPFNMVYEFDTDGLDKPKRVTKQFEKEFLEKYDKVPLSQLDLFLENEL